ncbi:MAG: nucleotidyltransferase domain-containing protein [Candidatus Doudnabacteria bacterium]|nr:nucleotidyltransferase domain-containing protein [Candidatus Doudnabacteria bacterium]
MLLPLATKTESQAKIQQEILSTLAFFSLYDLPISSKRVQELLPGSIVDLSAVETVLEILAADNKIYKTGNLYSLQAWKADDLRGRSVEISKKWHKIDRYFNWLALLPFVRMVSVVNSLALGTADADSDIDFFVITEKNRLYFVRSIIILLFRLLGVYKTKHKIKDRFCFGFFVSRDNLNLEPLMLKPADPYFINWLASMRPVLGGQEYWHLMQANNWLLNQMPNFIPMQRLASVKQPGVFIQSAKIFLEIISWLPSLAAEPLLRRIHINHTFKLAENHAITSTTIAQARILKLHASDVRAQVAQAHGRVLQSLR